MTDQLCAFLIYEHTEPFKELEGILKNLSVETWSINTCDSAERLFAQHEPSLVFVEISVWERESERLAELAKKATLVLNVIVVGALTDINLYVSSIKRGAFSFIAPPFAHDGLNILVHSAAMDVRERRDFMRQATVTSMQA
jgi:DNA-binding NtrC family response regulator